MLVEEGAEGRGKSWQQRESRERGTGVRSHGAGGGRNFGGKGGTPGNAGNAGTETGQNGQPGTSNVTRRTTTTGGGGGVTPSPCLNGATITPSGSGAFTSGTGPGTSPTCSPVIVDTRGEGFSLTSAEAGVMFATMQRMDRFTAWQSMAQGRMPPRSGSNWKTTFACFTNDKTTSSSRAHELQSK